jgi:hypothetical protein
MSRDPKFETNPMIKKQKIPNKLMSDLSVSFVADFELRISDFDSTLGAMKRQTSSDSIGTNGQKSEEASL